MNWLNGQSLQWQEPLTFASGFAEEDIALLFSGMQEAGGGQFSFLCITPIETIEGDDWSSLPTSESDPALPDWIGHLGYGLREGQPRGKPTSITFPDLRFTRYQHLFRFDHTQKQLTYFSRDGFAPHVQKPIHVAPRPPRLSITNLSSNFTRGSYETAVATTVARIHAGDFYQANITRKFFGHFLDAPDSWALFTALCNASPAPYSAYIRHSGSAILSASPECFLRIDATGEIISRPIKGSARRSDNPAEDIAIKQALQASPKNNAENLMITDLMRNDLARVSVPESVTVTEQSGLYSYATIHHLISTIRAQKRPDATLAETLRACFPPGSMTGAPKIAAMRWCAEQERIERGVYSGAIGWIAGGACDFSVVIRTLILDGKKFEFQVGGGIVADSTPEDEWRETLIKARGICAALGISENDLAKL